MKTPTLNAMPSTNPEQTIARQRRTIARLQEERLLLEERLDEQQVHLEAMSKRQLQDVATIDEMAKAARRALAILARHLGADPDMHAERAIVEAHDALAPIDWGHDRETPNADA